MIQAVKTVSETTLEEFATKVRGELVFPMDDTYNEERKIFNGMIDRRPGLIVKCVDVADVISCVNFGRENKLLIAIRGGGPMVVVSDFVMRVWSLIFPDSNLYG